MQKTIEVHGMSCGHCEGHVKKELEAVPGVESVEASAADKKAVVTLSEDVDDARLKEAVEAAGYKFVKVSE
ncbi:MAG: heavy-metal-associated domain-containing protein [Halanaerobiales bacterium]